MTPVDAVLALLILLGVWVGHRRGVVASGADLLALVGSVAWAFWTGPYAAAWLERFGMAGNVWRAPLAFVASYLIARLLLGLLLGQLVASVPPETQRHPANRTLGIVPGAGNGLINATLVAMLWLALPLSDALTDNARGSVLVNRLAAPAAWLEARLSPIFDPAIEKTAARLTVQPGSQESMALPFKVADAAPRPALEAQMLELVNRERTAQGLKPLVADAEVLPVARAHSRDMFARGYFSHQTPEGKTPFDRLRAAGLRFRAAGENLALARSLPMAHQGLMDSPGHRANILQPSFGRVGIGIVDGGRYGLMVTQNFRN